MDTTTQKNTLTNEEIDAFVGVKSNFYKKKWNKYSQSTFKGWNWAAFLIGALWIIYRKMYIEALLFLMFTFFIYMWSEVFIQSDIFTLFLDCFIFVLPGYCGNLVYYKKALRTLNKTSGLNESDLLKYLKDKGGVNLAGAIIFFLLMLASNALLIYFSF